MNLILILGSNAVGKMATGKRLSERLDYTLFHNHMSIEMPLSLFPYGSEGFVRLAGSIRSIVFEEMQKADRNLIFTYICAFDIPADVAFLNQLIADFEAKQHQVFILELHADETVRIERNKTALRLDEKPSKRDLEWSHQDLLSSNKNYRMLSLPGEIQGGKHLVVNNSRRSIDSVVDEFIETFDLG